MPVDFSGSLAGLGRDSGQAQAQARCGDSGVAIRLHA
jgi:hypothetical protein